MKRKHLDGDAYFEDSVLDAAYDRPANSRETVIHLSPADFLGLAKLRTDYSAGDKLSGTKELFQNGVKFNEIPYLIVETREDGDLDVVGHEGRHRSVTLKEHGIKRIPVILKSVPNRNAPHEAPSFRWGLTKLRPKKLYSQTIDHYEVDMPPTETY
jgi:hypothetical protein